MLYQEYRGVDMDKQTTVKLNEDDIKDLLTVLSWGLMDYPNPSADDERYLRIVDLVNRLEKAKCRVSGVKNGF